MTIHGISLEQAPRGHVKGTLWKFPVPIRNFCVIVAQKYRPFNWKFLKKTGNF